MSNEEKIAKMIMPAFRKSSKVEIKNESIKDIISSHWHAGVTLFTENTPDNALPNRKTKKSLHIKTDAYSKIS